MKIIILFILLFSSIQTMGVDSSSYLPPVKQEERILTPDDIIDYTDSVPDYDIDPDAAREHSGFISDQLEMGTSFNCNKYTPTHTEIGSDGSEIDVPDGEYLTTWNVRMTDKISTGIACNSQSPSALGELLGNFDYVNEWAYLTVVSTEYLQRLDESTRRIFGSNFNWDEIIKINPYCEQYGDAIKEARKNNENEVPKNQELNFYLKEENMPNVYMNKMIGQLNARPVESLVNGSNLNFQPIHLSLMELLEVRQKLEDSMKDHSSIPCKQTISTGGGSRCIRDRKKILAYKQPYKNQITAVEKVIRFKEAEYPYLSQDYESANSVFDIQKLMSFHSPEKGRESLKDLQKKYDTLKGLGLSEKDLQKKMRDAINPIIAKKKKQYKNLIAGICSTNIPSGQIKRRGKSIGFPWTALSSASGILKEVADNNPAFNGMEQCFESAAKRREKLNDMAAFAGAGLCAGVSIGLGAATLGVGAGASVVCAATFFGLEAFPKIDSSSALASAIGCQQILQKTCTPEDYAKIKDMDWWRTFAVVSAAVGEGFGLGMEAFTYGKKAILVLREMEAAQDLAEDASRLAMFSRLWKSETLAAKLGQDYAKASLDFLDYLNLNNPKYFLEATNEAEKLKIIEKYLLEKGISTLGPEEFLGKIDEVLKISGEAVGSAVDVIKAQSVDTQLFEDNSNLLYQLIDDNFFKLSDDAKKLEFLKTKFPGMSDESLNALLSEVERFRSDLSDPDGVIELLKKIEGSNHDEIASLLDFDSIGSDAISRAREIGLEGDDNAIKTLIFQERISAIASLGENELIKPDLQQKILGILQDPRISDDILAITGSSCGIE